MTQLRELGVGLSIDDFGTGYSSLSCLSELPIDSLKIDRSFVHRLQGSAESSEIVRAILTLGSSLGKQVIAEGVESEAQLARLEQLECGHGQGYLMAEPLSAREAAALFTDLSARDGPQGSDANLLAFDLRGPSAPVDKRRAPAH